MRGAIQSPESVRATALVKNAVETSAKSPERKSPSKASIHQSFPQKTHEKNVERNSDSILACKSLKEAAVCNFVRTRPDRSGAHTESIQFEGGCVKAKKGKHKGTLFCRPTKVSGFKDASGSE